MGEFFGTDGIRGVAGQHPMTAEFAEVIGRSAAQYFQQKGKSGFVIGKDTRLSGDMLEAALVEGIIHSGIDVHLAGVLPTPGIAYLACRLNACAGIVVSASHNPFQDNGIKFFDAQGYKLTEESETAFEKLIKAVDAQTVAEKKYNQSKGRICHIDQAGDQYSRFLHASMPEHLSLGHLKVIIDCSNGATFQVAPALLSALGVTLKSLNISPDGKNINAACGSEHPKLLALQVKSHTADVGLAFDGDGDRLIAVDETGNTLSGDQLMAIFAKDLYSQGKLDRDTVVTTVMSNMGFHACMDSLGVRHVTSGVGDRLVMQKMQSVGAILGGENSGHMIFRKLHSTGDGLLSALQLLRIMSEQNKPLSELAAIMSVYPQALVNVSVSRKPDIVSVPAVKKIIDEIEAELNGKGRVLVRYSGTQPLCRVMVEAASQQESDNSAQRIAAVIEKKLN